MKVKNKRISIKRKRLTNKGCVTDFKQWNLLTNFHDLFRMAEKKKEAEAAVELMTALYERICIDEKNKKGLIITSATYGKISDEELDEGKVFGFYECRGKGLTLEVTCYFSKSLFHILDLFVSATISPLS